MIVTRCGLVTDHRLPGRSVRFEMFSAALLIRTELLGLADTHFMVFTVCWGDSRTFAKTVRSY